MNRDQLNSPSNITSPDKNKQSNNLGPLRNSMSPDFIPFDYSSPLSSFKNRSLINKPYNKVIGVYDNSSPSRNISFNSFSPNSCNNSFGSSNSNVSGYVNNKFSRFKKGRFNEKSDCNDNNYFHFSMLDDPWENLEVKLVEQVGAEKIKIVNKKGSSVNSLSYNTNSTNDNSFD